MAKSTTAELRNQDSKALLELVAEKREKLRQLRFDLRSGKVKNLKEVHSTKKDIARILTLINEKKQK